MAVEIREFRPEDAPALARLFQASDAGWPEGFVYARLLTPEELMELLSSANTRATYLAWTDGIAVGYADIFPHEEDDNAAYLGLLTVDPAYYGRGVGRDLVRRCVDKCVELGYDRLDLDTWPGNTRALPLYKKTGFYWGPEVEQLRNHVPFLLAHPLTRSSFEGRDWYSSLRREFRLGPDAEKRNGALVHSYIWTDGERELRATFDQKTKRLVALETDRVLLSLEADAPEALWGREVGARFCVANHGREPLAVAVRAGGEGPVSAELYRTLSVPPGGEPEAVGFAAKADGEKTGDGAIKLDVLVDGIPVALEASLKVSAPIEMELAPLAPALRPGVPAQFTVNIISRIEREVDLRLLPSPSDGLEVDLSRTVARLDEASPRLRERRYTVEEATSVGSAASSGAPFIRLESKGVVGFPLSLRATRSGVHRLTIGAALADGRPDDIVSPLDVELATVGSGEVWISRVEDATLLVGEDVHVRAPKKGLRHTLHERRTGAELWGQSVGVGPPYWPSAAHRQDWDVTAERSGGSATVILSGTMKEPADVRLERRLTLLASGELSSSVRLVNLGHEPRRVRLHLLNRPAKGERAAYIPAREGVMRGEDGLPGWPEFGSEGEAAFVERWAALELGEWTIGASWPEVLASRLSGEWWSRLRLRSELLTLLPGDSWASGEVRILPTRAGWREVARSWSARYGMKLGPRDILSAVGVRVRPSPVLLVGNAAEITVEARSLTPRKYVGAVHLAAQGELTAEPRELVFSELSSDGHQSAKASIRKLGGARSAGVLSLRAEFPMAHSTTEVPVLTMGEGEGDVRVEQGEDAGECVYRVDNGWLSFAVRPQVLGAVYRLHAPEGELLATSFPNPEPRQWLYPSYGGVTPVVWKDEETYPHNLLGALAGLTLSTEEAEVEGPETVRWRGVKLGAELQHPALRGLRFEIAYLTLPQSNVLVVLSALSSSGAARRAYFGLQVSPALSAGAPLMVGPDDADRVRANAGFGGAPRGERWVSAEHGTTGRNLALVQARGNYVMASDLGTTGFRLHGVWHGLVPGGGMTQTCHYLVAARDRREVELYGALADTVLSMK